MRISFTSPAIDLSDDDKRRIEADLEKVDRRLKDFDVDCAVRINYGQSTQNHKYQVHLEVHYRSNHILAKAENDDIGQGVREAREEVLRQINDRSRGGHSSFAKHT